MENTSKAIWLILLIFIACNENKLEISQKYFETGKEQEKLQHLDSATIFY